MLEPQEQNDLLALLAWWREAGVDCALDEQAVDWTADPTRWPGQDFVWPDREAPAVSGAVTGPVSTVSSPRPGAPLPAASQAPRPPMPRPSLVPPPATAPPAQRPFTAVAPDAATMTARTLAAKAQSLEALQELLAGFDGCGLKATARSLCFYRGSPEARLMIIGEAPGRDEDIEGRPFVGMAGQLLDRMLAAIDLKEEDVHITNIVYWRPPGNRTPTPQEAQVCRPFLERQIELVAPDFVLTLGGPATKAMLDVADGIMKVRGKWREVELGGKVRRVMPSLHPAYLLRTPLAKRQVWRDLLAVKAALRGDTSK
ncbi:MAG: uracil-DNA glycosylase family protein [Hyphomicrobiaceae bacterium]